MFTKQKNQLINLLSNFLYSTLEINEISDTEINIFGNLSIKNCIHAYQFSDATNESLMSAYYKNWSICVLITESNVSIDIAELAGINLDQEELKSLTSLVNYLETKLLKIRALLVNDVQYLRPSVSKSLVCKDYLQFSDILCCEENLFL